MKKKVLKWLGGLSAFLLVLILIVGFSFSDPQADLNIANPVEGKTIVLSEVPTEFTKVGVFKSSVDFHSPNNNGVRGRDFYGQRITVGGNPNVDRIDIGITSNLISRVEIWNGDELVDIKELGFMDKMTWGDTQRLYVEMTDETNSRYSGKSEVKMRFTKGTGFFGDIGTLSFDLSKYGSFSGEKTIDVFQKPLIAQKGLQKGEFSNFRVWKNFASAD
ncbi:hypothetical protein [Owenweeksia hongkongensis]|uniref:hypothetical protein n=1 Tax=Owenweeksia hongkongensis TaxID=253245 RepID=UPI003A92217F